jgi:hypothetical protein
MRIVKNVSMPPYAGADAEGTGSLQTVKALRIIFVSPIMNFLAILLADWRR